MMLLPPESVVQVLTPSRSSPGLMCGTSHQACRASAAFCFRQLWRKQNAFAKGQKIKNVYFVGLTIVFIVKRAPRFPSYFDNLNSVSGGFWGRPKVWPRKPVRALLYLPPIPLLSCSLPHAVMYHQQGAWFSLIKKQNPQFSDEKR